MRTSTIKHLVELQLEDKFTVSAEHALYKVCQANHIAPTVGQVNLILDNGERSFCLPRLTIPPRDVRIVELSQTGMFWEITDTAGIKYRLLSTTTMVMACGVMSWA